MTRMQIIHHISISSSPEIQAELKSMGIVVAGHGLVSFDLDESKESWPKVQRWISMRQAVDVARTAFSMQEIKSAKWLELMPDWHHGYPQPNEDVFGYREVTYDLSDYCVQCGIGLKQRAPFRMKSEPRWGRNGIMQLNWIFDEYFVRPEVWRQVFEPRGIGCCQVLNTRGIELTTVLQLAISQEVDIVTDGLLVQPCTACGRFKYVPVTRGPFPKLAREPAGHMAKTRQYFGSGASASKRIIISQELGSALMKTGVRGASLRPVAESSSPMRMAS